MYPQAAIAPHPAPPFALVSAPVSTPPGMGDWLDSSLELQHGVLVTEWHLPAWDPVPAALVQPATH